MPGSNLDTATTSVVSKPILADAPPSEPALPSAEHASALSTRRDSKLDQPVGLLNGQDATPPTPKTADTSTSVLSKEDQYALKQFLDDDRHFNMVRNFRLADLVTIMNGACGSLSVFSSANYMLTSDRSYLWKALAFPVAGMIFDLFDGKVARWRNEASMLGQELDSLADSLSFGVAPALVAFTIGLRSSFDMLALTLFICCGIARLARFNATVAHAPKDATGKAKFFEGLPIPTSLGIVTLMAECARRDWIEGPGGIGQGLPGGIVSQLVPFGIDLHWTSFVFVAWAMAMVSKSLKVPKP